MSNVRPSPRVRLPHRVVLLAVAGAVVGCYASRALRGGEDAEELAPADGGAADAAPDGADGAPTDAGGDGEGDASGAEDGGDGPDATPGPCPGGWYDPATERCWEAAPAEGRSSWAEAVSYCDALSMEGAPAGSFRLPTISELRSMLRGCPETMTGGACGVSDTCLGGRCTSSACSSCDYLAGPGSGGCYWDAGVEGVCTWYWSSSTFAGSSYYAWVVDFFDGSVYSAAKTNSRSVRCIRR